MNGTRVTERGCVRSRIWALIDGDVVGSHFVRRAHSAAPYGIDHTMMCNGEKPGFEGPSRIVCRAYRVHRAQDFLHKIVNVSVSKE